MTSFMNGLYRGIFDAETFFSFGIDPDYPAVQSVLEAFQELLRDFPPHEIEKRGSLPEEMLERMARMGLFGLSIPVAYGGMGMSLGTYLETVSRITPLDMAVALTSIAHLSIGVKGIELFGTEQQKERYLRAAASGSMIFSYALTEPRIGSDAQHIETRAELERDGGHYLLNGQKTFITNADYAGALTVFAQMDPVRPGFMGAFIVETGWEGVKVGKEMPKMGLIGSSTAPIQFRDVRVPVENLIGKPGDGFKIAMSILNYGRLALGAASAGMMNRSLLDMAKRASTRQQFGTPIENFPLIQEKLANARVNSWVTKALYEFTAHLLTRNPVGNFAIETSHCKLFGTTRGWQTIYDAMQVAGGSGYLKTNPYEKRMRDFRVATVFEGTTEIHSMYPALATLRSIGSTLKNMKKSRAAHILFMLRNGFARTPWPLEFRNSTLRKASRLARCLAGSIKRTIFMGSLVYGQKAARKQFYLRRISSMSLYLFGLIAVLAKLRLDEQRGNLSKEELGLLNYFIEQTKETKSMNNRLLDSRLERLIKSVSSVSLK